MGGRPPSEGGAFGPIQLSRACGPSPMMPVSQGYIGTGGTTFMPTPRFVVPAPPLGIQQMPAGYGVQFAPGQGGDTPGGGGTVPGDVIPVQSAWIVDGTVMPLSIQHIPGTVGFVGSRRSGA